MIARPTIVIEPGAHAWLPTYLADRSIRRVALVADTNTYVALGRRVEALLTGGGFDVRTIGIKFNFRGGIRYVTDTNDNSHRI